MDAVGKESIMNKTTIALAFAFVSLFAGAAVSADSFVGYDEQGNQVHVVNGQIVSTIPRAAIQGQVPIPVQPGAAGSVSRNSSVRQRSGTGHGPFGRWEKNPYESGKWRRDEVGMIDAINRDHPPVYSRR